jgi:hypothetical protein
MTTADLLRFWSWLRRFPFCVTCAILSIAMAVASWFLWQQVQSLEDVLGDRSKEGDNTLATVVSGTVLRPDLAYIRGFTRRIDDNLVTVDNLAGNKSYFYNFEMQTKVHIVDMQQLSSPAPDSDSLYRRVPFALRLTGSYDQLAAFLRAVETGPRLSNVTAFAFRRNAPPAPPLSLDLNVDLLGKL